MKYLFIILLFALSCKKKESAKPLEVANVEVYCKSANATVNTNILETINTQHFNKSFEVSDPEIVIYVKNNVKSSNDSINIKVTYLGITKQQGMKCVNTIGNVGFQLSSF
jgi:predicted component of type VI protein secretion system